MKTKQFLISILISTGLIFTAGLNQNELIAQDSFSQSKVEIEEFDQSGPKSIPPSDINDQIEMTNFPEPFIEVTYIQYTLPFPAHVRLYVYESSTGKSRMLFEGAQIMGTHLIAFIPDGNLPGEYVAELITLQSTVKEVMYREVAGPGDSIRN